MKILWVKVGGLWPLNVGGRLRSFHIIAELARRHRVTVVTTHAPGDDRDAAAAHLPDCERVVSFPFAAPKAGTFAFTRALARSWTSQLPVDLLKWRVPALRAEVDRIVRRGEADVVVADFLYASANLPDRCPAPVILFEHNVEHTIWRRLAANESRPWRRAPLELEWRKMRASERVACTRANAVVAVSSVDAASILENAPMANVRSIPTGVDTTYFTANGTPERDAHIVFTGAMDWYPNEDAMLWFVGDILPLIRRAVPNATLTIAGRNPSLRLRDTAARAGVQVTGTVADVRSFIDEGAVYAVPLRIGGGTRLKIFEALSMRKAVVSTSVGAEGLPVVDGEEFVRADDPAAFASAVVTLLRDPARRKALGNAGSELVRSRYSWPAVTAAFERHCHEVINT